MNSNLPNGKVKLNLIKTKDLIKADLIGKSDPYAIIKYEKQLQKTKTIKNTLEPQWNHEAVVEPLEEYMMAPVYEKVTEQITTGNKKL